MNILGLSTFADASTAIVGEGKIICAVEEERLNRIKHYEGMPWLSIQECLEIAGMSLGDIDLIAIGWNPYLGWGARIGETVKSLTVMPGAFKGKVSRGNGYVKGCWELWHLKKSLAKRYGENHVKQEVKFVPHHVAHAASSFLSSPYEAANIMVADGVGESATISFFSGEGNTLTRVGQIDLPHSLGHLYASVTGFLGFRMTCDEGKTMALAGYGEDSYRELFDRLVYINPIKKIIEVDTKILDYHAARKGVFSKKWLELTRMKPRQPDEPLTQQHKDLASSLQKCLEEKVLALLRIYFPDGLQCPLCAAGGLFLNSVLNGRILRDYTQRYFVQPASGDNGVSVGAALYVGSVMDADYNRHLMTDAYLGREYDQGNIQTVLDKRSFSLQGHIPNGRDKTLQNTITPAGWGFTRHRRASPAAPEITRGHPAAQGSNIFAETAELLVQGKVVGWYQGRMEFGPRALGNRSILASPVRPEIKDIVNRKVKHREEFRPFAVSVMKEDVSEYFEEAQESPFMLKVFYFRDKYKHTFPAVNHCDNSCRFQTVTPEMDLYKLLIEMKKRTGYGMVLNTSMNVMGEPIVNTPEEAINLLNNSELDYMVMGDFVVGKDQ